MYNWIIVKYGKLNVNWTDLQFDIIADDVYTTFFDQPEHAKAKIDVEDVVEPDIQDVAPTEVVEADQDVLECSKKEDQQEVAATYIIEPDTGASKKDEKDGEDDKKYEEEDETDDEDDELWTPKNKGTTSKCLPAPKSKGTSIQEKEQARKGKRKLGV
ncbi:hypothetical protein Tco_1219263 [Tanacetum coccineum]